MATLTASAGSCPTEPPLASPRRIVAQSQPKNAKSRRSKRPLLNRASTYVPPTWQHGSRCRFASSQAHLRSWPNPHSTRGTAAAHIPRFRALALFGRRPSERVDSPAISASENLHNSRHCGCARSLPASLMGSGFADRPRLLIGCIEGIQLTILIELANKSIFNEVCNRDPQHAGIMDRYHCLHLCQRRQ